MQILKVALLSGGDREQYSVSPHAGRAALKKAPFAESGALEKSGEPTSLGTCMRMTIICQDLPQKGL